VTPRVREWLEAALDDPAPVTTLDDVQRALEANEAQLWAGNRSAMVTHICDYRNGVRALEFWLAGGELEEILQGLVQVEQWARSAGCTQMHVNGRPGWARVLRNHGFSHWQTVTRKIL
jgi:hypothetical protein